MIFMISQTSFVPFLSHNHRFHIFLPLTFCIIVCFPHSQKLFKLISEVYSSRYTSLPLSLIYTHWPLTDCGFIMIFMTPQNRSPLPVCFTHTQRLFHNTSPPSLLQKRFSYTSNKPSTITISPHLPLQHNIISGVDLRFQIYWGCKNALEACRKISGSHAH